MAVGIIVIQIIIMYFLVTECNKWKKECYTWMNKYTIIKQKYEQENR